MSPKANNTLNFLCSAGPHANATVTSTEADEIMMQTGGSIMAQGRLYEIMSRRLSPKVFKLTIKLANP